MFAKGEPASENTVIFRENFPGRAGSPGVYSFPGAATSRRGAWLSHVTALTTAVIVPQHLGRVSAATCHYSCVVAFMAENCFSVPASRKRGEMKA